MYIETAKGKEVKSVIVNHGYDTNYDYSDRGTIEAAAEEMATEDFANGQVSNNLETGEELVMTYKQCLELAKSTLTEYSMENVLKLAEKGAEWPANFGYVREIEDTLEIKVNQDVVGSENFMAINRKVKDGEFYNESSGSCVIRNNSKEDEILDVIEHINEETLDAHYVVTEWKEGFIEELSKNADKIGLTEQNLIDIENGDQDISVTLRGEYIDSCVEVDWTTFEANINGNYEEFNTKSYIENALKENDGKFDIENSSRSEEEINEILDNDDHDLASLIEKAIDLQKEEEQAMSM